MRRFRVAVDGYFLFFVTAKTRAEAWETAVYRLGSEKGLTVVEARK